MQKKTLALLMCLLMLAPAVVACAEKKDDGGAKSTGDQTSVATDADTAETEIQDNLPEEKFDGYEFKITSLYEKDIGIEEDTGEALDTAIFQRDQKIMERFDVKFVLNYYSDYSKANEAVRNVVGSMSTDEIDAAVLHMVDGSKMIAAGTYYAISDMPYINLSQPYWDSAASNAFGVGGKLYMTTGDICSSTLMRTSCMAFNKNLFRDKNLTEPYQLAYDGKWTLDSLYEYTRNSKDDLNGDGKYRENDDFFGMTSWHLDSPYSFYYGAGGSITQKDEDDLPYLDLNLEKNANIYEKIYQVVIENESNYHTDINTYLNSYKVFLEGRALFCEASVDKFALDEWRNMEQDYGVLPIPKYDESQEEYLSFVNGAAGLLCVPVSISDAERTSIILEALACESYKKVTPVLYEITAKTKGASRDLESADMIDLVFRNRVFDFAYANFFGNGIVDFVRDLLDRKSTDVASTFSKNEKSLTKQMDKLIDKFQTNL